MVSATLGRDDARYQVAAAGKTMHAQNPAQALQADFTRRGLQVSAGASARWQMSLRGYGYGDRLEQVGEALPRSNRNRVEYRRGRMVEWYVNGPVGLEQGFTLSAPPASGRNSAPLTIALGLGGDLTASTYSPSRPQPDAKPTELTLRDSSGRAVLRYTGLNAHDASGHELAAWLELGREEVRLRVNDAGAQYPVVVDPFVEVAKLTASDAMALAQLGSSVALSGDGSTIAVGQTGINGFIGAVYVFVKPGSGWASATESAKLTPSDGVANDEFAFSVGVSNDGSTIVAGAWQAKDGTANRKGAAYVFVKPMGGWVSATQTAKLTASDAEEELGLSVGVNGDGSVVVAGSPGAVGSKGAAYVFVKPMGGWADTNETAKLTASDGATDDELGTSAGVSGDGNTIASGATQAKIGANHEQGAVYVFAKPGGGWASETQTAKLTTSDGAAFDRFGGTVGLSINGGVIVSGTPDAAGGQGEAYVFVEPGMGGWVDATETGKLTASDGGATDELGFSVAISGDGNTIIADAAGVVVPGNHGQGAVYVYVKPISGWTTEVESAVLTATDGAMDDLLRAVGLSADALTIVAGSPGFNADAGQAYVFFNKAPTTTSITSNLPNPSVVGQTVTVDFTVSPPMGDARTPAGSVTVNASTGESCMGSLSSGSGSCMLTFNTSGSRTLTAKYGGDANFLDSTSMGASQSVEDFSIAASPPSQTIPSGHAGLYTITLTGLGGLTGSVSLACSGGPPNSTCIITPSAVMVSGTASAKVVLHPPKNVNHGTFTLTFTGIFGSGNPATGGLTHSISVSLRVK